MKRGFTLIELLVAISIIGILSVLIISNLSDARGRARDSARKSNLRELKTALRLYYNDNQKYPADSAAIGDPDGLFDSTDEETIYMKKLPAEFTYALGANDDSFTLKVTLENASDSDIDASQATCLGAPDETLDYYVCED